MNQANKIDYVFETLAFGGYRKNKKTKNKKTKKI
jgi:hypothetical protein